MQHLFWGKILRTKISFKAPVFLSGTGRNDFYAGKSIPGPLEAVGLENQDFCGPEMGTSDASAIWAQKSGMKEIHSIQLTLRPLMGENPLHRPLEGVGPENRDLFGPWNGNEQNSCT